MFNILILNKAYDDDDDNDDDFYFSLIGREY